MYLTKYSMILSQKVAFQKKSCSSLTSSKEFRRAFKLKGKLVNQRATCGSKSRNTFNNSNKHNFANLNRYLTVPGRLHDAVEFSPKTNKRSTISNSQSHLAALFALVGAASLFIPVDASLAWALHEEPANALSIPTWAIHISSLIEWLVAMGLIWQYADVVGNPKWKGLTWGMVPLHTSGICACTFHFFYNSENVESLVALQAFLTLVGNFTLWWAAYRIYLSVQEEEEEEEVLEELPEPAGLVPMKGGEVLAATKEESEDADPFLDLTDLGQVLSEDTDFVFVGKLAAISVAGAFAVKYGSLLIDAPFEADIRVALGIIFIPTGFNILKWIYRSVDSKKTLVQQDTF